MKKSIILITLLIFLAIPLVSAEQEVRLSAVPVTYNVEAGQPLEIELTIRNVGDRKDTYAISVLGIEWLTESYSNIYTIGPGKTDTLTIMVTPVKTLSPGRYLLRLGAASIETKGISDIAELVVSVESPPSDILVSLDEIESSINPTQSNELIINLKNRNNIPERDLTLEISGEFLTTSIPFSLDSLEQKQITQAIQLDPATPPGETQLTFKILKQGAAIYTLKKKLFISAESPVLEYETTSESFLQKSSTVTKENKGNAITGASITQELNQFEKIFTKFDPAPTEVEKVNGQYLVGWAFNLDPGEGYTVNQVTDYQILAIAGIIILLIAIFLYISLRERMIITKQIIMLRKGKEGISDVKVVLNLKNRGGPLEDVRIADKAPKFVTLTDEFGTVKPSSTKKMSSGKLIVWNIEKFSKHDELILSYKIKCKLKIIGQFVLPKAVVSYKKNNKTVKAHSKPIMLDSE